VVPIYSAPKAKSLRRTQGFTRAAQPEL
jgi:hypothetical protein